jgi:hypothetical protein
MVPLETKQNPEIREPELNLLLPEGTLEVPLWKSLFAAIDAALFPKKLPPLVLTSKPVSAGELWGEHLTRPWWRSVFENLGDVFFPKKLPPLELTSKPNEGQNELDDDLALPWYRSLYSNVQEALFPKKLPPLELTSRPVAVKEIWGFYDHKKDGALVSTAVHVVGVALLIGGTMLVRNQVATAKPTGPVMPLLSDSDIPPLPPSKTLAAVVVTTISWLLPKADSQSSRWNSSLRPWWSCATRTRSFPWSRRWSFHRRSSWP